MFKRVVSITSWTLFPKRSYTVRSVSFLSRMAESTNVRLPVYSACQAALSFSLVDSLCLSLVLSLRKLFVNFPVTVWTLLYLVHNPLFVLCLQQHPSRCLTNTTIKTMVLSILIKTTANMLTSLINSSQVHRHIVRKINGKSGSHTVYMMMMRSSQWSGRANVIVARFSINWREKSRWHPSFVIAQLVRDCTV